MVSDLDHGMKPIKEAPFGMPPNDPTQPPAHAGGTNTPGEAGFAWPVGCSARFGARRSAPAVKKKANAMTAAQKRTLSSRSHLLTTALHSFGGASGRQVILALLIG